MNTIKILANIVCALFVSLSLVSCSRITVKGENGQTFESYQECCAAQDFMAAHTYLAKMENAMGEDWDKIREYKTAREYVFKQEFLYLMSLGDETAKKRIIFLLKEEGKEEKNINNHIAMLIDLAIENDDIEFVKNLTKQYTIGVEDNNLKKIYNFLSEKESTNNKEFLINEFKRLNKGKLLISTGIDTNDKALIQEYATSISLNDEEIVTKLAKQNVNYMSDLVLSLLTDEQKYIDPLPSLGITSYYWSNEKKEFIEKCESYESDIRRFNQKCVKIMDIGIICKNIYLSRGVINKMKSNIKHNELSPKNDYYRINVTLGDNSDILAARKVLDDAIRKGTFR